MPSLMKPLKADEKKNSILHAILFNKDKFTLKDAKLWLSNHKYTYIHNRQSENFYRFRIKETILGYNFFTKKFKNGVEMVYMYKMA